MAKLRRSFAVVIFVSPMFIAGFIGGTYGMLPGCLVGIALGIPSGAISMILWE